MMVETEDWVALATIVSGITWLITEHWLSGVPAAAGMLYLGYAMFFKEG